MTTSRSPSHVAALDGVRAVAIVLVLARHGARHFHDGPWRVGSWDAATPLINGWVGVDLFFVLSGLLIGQQLFGRYGGRLRRRDIGDYLRRRAWRILPAYLAVLAVIVFGLVPNYAVASTNLARDTLVHLAFWQDQGDVNLMAGFWSLGVEEKFYLVAPLLVGLSVGMSPRRRVAFLGAMAVVPGVLRVLTLWWSGVADGYVEWFQRFRSPAHLTADGLLVGLAAAAALAEPRSRAWLAARARTLGMVGWGLFAALVVASPLVESPTLADHIVLQPLLAVLGAAICVSAALGGGGALLSWKGFRPIATGAYTLYLTHQLVIPTAAKITGTEGDVGPSAFLRFAGPYVAMTVAVAWGLHITVERWGLDRRDRTRPLPDDESVEPTDAGQMASTMAR